MHNDKRACPHCCLWSNRDSFFMNVLAPDMFHKDFLKTGKRLDGRNQTDTRQISATENCLDGTKSSALIAMGKSIVIAKIDAIPQPISPSLEITLNKSAVSSSKGVAAPEKILKAHVTWLCSNFLNMEELVIARPDSNDIFQSSVKLWGYKLNIQANIISNDGGIEVAVLLAIHRALQCLVVEEYNLDEEGKLEPTDKTRKLSLIPISGLRFASIDGKIYYDPTIDEEKIAEGCCTVITSIGENGKTKLMKLTTNGSIIIDEKIVGQMISACSI